MLVLRLTRPGSVAHVAVHTAREWQSRCTQLWDGSEWIDQGRQLVTRPGFTELSGGRPLSLDALDELPLNVRLCTRCIARVYADASAVDRAQSERGRARGG